MPDFIMAEDSELWDVIFDGPFVPTKNLGDPAVAIPKTRKEFNDADRKAVEKNFRANRISECQISACQSTKEIWEALQTAHEGTTQVKQSKIDMLITEYELFRMKDDESIQDIHTRLTYIINELHSLEARDLQELTIDELVGNLKIYEIKKKKKDNEIREPKREKNPVFKAVNNDSSSEDGDMAYLTRRFQKMVRKNGGIRKRGSSSPNIMTSIPRGTRFLINASKRKNAADNVVKQALAARGDSSNKSEEENDHGNSTMMEVESEAIGYDSIFALMAQSDDDEDDNDGEETIENLKKEKDALDEKIANIEHERDDLMVIVVDLKETFECVRKEKEVLAKRVTNIEHERDDLLVVVVDLKETIRELKM
ncbi:uncharacterized protein [Nicotiana tomentosiformis]|uniref:uncharacterized protein n=1 Tax=Nicotiana tomentosiformis TaxID=4098 RepID=UPI00388C9D4D